MRHKPKKGYFVKGVFVASGSALDLQLKSELKGSASASKTDLKRESTERQELGVSLLSLSPQLRAQLLDKGHLSVRLLEALDSAKSIRDFEGRRRQLQYVGKLMREHSAADIEAINTAVQEQHQGSAEEVALLHQAEQWRDSLLADDARVSDWMAAFPATDSQQLRALLRQARKDRSALAQNAAPGLAPRQARAARDLFQMIKRHLQSHEPPRQSVVPE